LFVLIKKNTIIKLSTYTKYLYECRISYERLSFFHPVYWQSRSDNNTDSERWYFNKISGGKEYYSTYSRQPLGRYYWNLQKSKCEYIFLCINKLRTFICIAIIAGIKKVRHFEYVILKYFSCHEILYFVPIWSFMISEIILNMVYHDSWVLMYRRPPFQNEPFPINEIAKRSIFCQSKRFPFPPRLLVEM